MSFLLTEIQDWRRYFQLQAKGFGFLISHLPNLESLPKMEFLNQNGLALYVNAIQNLQELMSI